MHMGIIVIVVGGFVGRLWGIEGILKIGQGARATHFFLEDGSRHELGFEVELEKFEVEYYLPKVRVRIPGEGREMTVAASQGEEIGIPSGGRRLRIVGYYPAYVTTRTILEPGRDRDPLPEGGQDLEAGPAIKIEAVTGRGAPSRWVIAEEAAAEEPEPKAFDILFYKCRNLEQLDRWRRPPEERPEELTVSIHDEEIRRSFPIEPGRGFAASDRYTVQILRYVPDFAKRDLPPEGQSADNPALHVRIEGPGGKEDRWVFARFPDFDSMHRVKDPNIRLLYRKPDPSRSWTLVRFLEGPEGRLEVIQFDQRKIVLKARPQVGDRIELTDHPIAIKLLEHRPKVTIRFTDRSLLDRPLNPVVRVAVDGSDAKDTFLLGAGRDWRPLGHTGIEVKLVQVQRIKDYRSTMKVHDDDRVAVRHGIEVNQPLSYKGFSFYQMDYDKEWHRYTVLQVSKDPGNLVVYAGFIAVTIGLLYACLIQPFLPPPKGKA
jgi:hypothetical protein